MLSASYVASLKLTQIKTLHFRKLEINQWHSHSRKFACFIYLTHTMKKKKKKKKKSISNIFFNTEQICEAKTQMLQKLSCALARKELMHLPPPSHDPSGFD